MTSERMTRQVPMMVRYSGVSLKKNDNVIIRTYNDEWEDDEADANDGQIFRGVVEEEIVQQEGHDNVIRHTYDDEWEDDEADANDGQIFRGVVEEEIVQQEGHDDRRTAVHQGNLK